MKPEFKVGDKLFDIEYGNNYVINFVDLDRREYKLFNSNKSIKFRDQNKYKIIPKPLFNEGQTIKRIETNEIFKVANINTFNYTLIGQSIPSYFQLSFCFQNNFIAIDDKFNLNNLIPFESKVLVRNSATDEWKPAVFGYITNNKNRKYCIVGGLRYKFLIPYNNDNINLLGRTENCKDYYVQ